MSLSVYYVNKAIR